MGIEEGKELQAKDIEDIFNKMIAENSQNLVLQVQEAFRTPKTQDKKRIFQRYLILKTLNIQNKENQKL
jgi:adenine C2-methylase RlmN of 23S rRNA A2503 and tRNA A37